MYERSLCVGGFETEVIVFIVCREKKKRRAALQMEGFMIGVGEVMMSMGSDCVLCDCNICQTTKAVQP